MVKGKAGRSGVNGLDVRTERTGRFRLPIDQDDRLEFSGVPALTCRVVVETVTKTLFIALAPSKNNLI